MFVSFEDVMSFRYAQWQKPTKYRERNDLIMNNIVGKAYVFGANIDTDQIYPGKYLEITDHKEIGSHCLEGARADFPKVFEKGGIVVATTNFGCGSSREHAAITLVNVGVSAVIAKSFARIFYRNAINMGITLIICPQIESIAQEGATLEIDIKNATVTNKDSGQSVPCEKISDFAMKILTAGGIKNLYKKIQ